MAEFNGKTPEQIAADIIAAATESQMIEISGVANQNLLQVLRYKYAKKIYSKGEKWFQANLETLQTEFIEGIIEAQYKQRQKLDEKQEKDDLHDYVRTLVSRGVNRYVAMEMAGLISAEDVAAANAIKEAEALKSAELQKLANAELAATELAAIASSKKK